MNKKVALFFALVWGLLFLWALTLKDPAKSNEPVELPPEILACTTDADCEYQAMLLCEAGYLEWCVEEV